MPTKGRPTPEDRRSRPTTRLFSNEPVSFVMKSDNDSTNTSPQPSTTTDSNFGVQSLADAIHVADSFQQTSHFIPNTRSRNPSQISSRQSASDDSDYDSPLDLSPHRPIPWLTTRSPSIRSSSQPPSPTFSHSPSHALDPLNTPKSTTSLPSSRLSDGQASPAGGSSVAMAQASEVGESSTGRRQLDHLDLARTHTPQLVMPTMDIPSRRPFTQRGAQLGELKILVAGLKGVGKTSFIKSMVQVWEDIVHVDSPLQIPSAGALTETHASTRPLPAGRSHLSTSQNRTRRSSIRESVLDRNICFVDTPSSDSSSSFQLHSATILHHLQGLMHRNLSPSSMNDSDFLSIFGGSGGLQVDLVLYIKSGMELSLISAHFSSSLLFQSCKTVTETQFGFKIP